MATDKKPDKPEAGGFLSISGIDAKIAALQELKESILRAVSVGALGQPGDIDVAALQSVAGIAARPSDQPIDLPTGAFLNKSMPEAIKLLYMATKRKFTPADVAAALREGGFESTSQNFEGTVSGTMYRMKDQGILLKFKDGFGLTEFYPEHIRAKIAEASKPNKARSNKKTKVAKATKAPKAAKAKRAKVERAVKVVSRPPRKTPTEKSGLEGRIETHLGASGAATSQAIAEALGMNPGAVRMALGKLAKRGRVIRDADGRYAPNVTFEPRLRAV